MATDLAATDAAFQGWITRASLLVKTDLLALARRGPQRELARTRFLQPLLVCVSLGYLQHLLRHGLRPDLCLGHSLGEISAFAAAGVVTPETAIDIAVHRGALMEEAASRTHGGMLAVATSRRDEVLRLASTLHPPDSPALSLAADNTPEQLVFSGTSEALDAFAARLQHDHLGSTRPLAVSGPWHSPAMAEARMAFERYLVEVEFRSPACPLIPNVTGTAESNPSALRLALGRCLTEPVRWRDSMNQLRLQGVRELIEVGPGRVLAGLARANGFGNEVQVTSVGTLRAADGILHRRLCDSPRNVPPDTLPA